MLTLDSAALDEIHEAAAWYEERRAGLGDEILAEVERTLKLVEARPASFPRLRDVPDELVIRRVLLHRFPYGLVYLHQPTGDLRIVAFAHAKRRPGYWLWRVQA